MQQKIHLKTKRISNFFTLIDKVKPRLKRFEPTKIKYPSSCSGRIKHSCYCMSKSSSHHNRSVAPSKQSVHHRNDHKKNHSLKTALDCPECAVLTHCPVEHQLTIKIHHIAFVPLENVERHHQDQKHQDYSLFMHPSVNNICLKFNPTGDGVFTSCIRC